MVSQNVPSRNTTVMVRTRIERMLGAPRSRSAHARCGTGGAWRLQARRPQASPLCRLVLDHLHRLQTVYDERFVRDYGPWRPVVAQVADKFLACGVLDHGYARIRCDDCAHEYLLAFSCKCRYFCPSCHAKRLAFITQASVIDQILTHLRARAVHAGARSPPSTRAPASRGTSRAPRPSADALTVP
jgi:hypothetical protein